jgi:hypothetical protein
MCATSAWGNGEGCAFLSKGSEHICDNWGTELVSSMAAAAFRAEHPDIPSAAASSGYHFVEHAPFERGTPPDADT